MTAMHAAGLTAPDSWYWHDLQRAAGTRVQLHCVAWRELTAQICRPTLQSRPENLITPPCDAVLVRSMPPASLEQVVFRMDALAVWQRQSVVVVNPPKALEAAIDKYLTLARLAELGLPVPPTVVCQTVEQAMLAYEQLGPDVVIKPLFGGEGRGIARVTDQDLALRAFKMLVQLGCVVYLQPFLPHPGFDYRVLILGSQTWVMQRHNPSDWRSNIGRGGVGKPARIPAAWIDLARAAADAVGAPFAGVDLLPLPDDQVVILEVNAVPGWKTLANVLQVDIADQVLKYLIHVQRNAPAGADMPTAG